MALVKALETQLRGYWQTVETQKTWEHWQQWSREMGLSLSFTPLPTLSPHEKFNYQRFLSLCEEDLYELPEWKEKLTNPHWLQAQKLVIIPTSFSLAQENLVPEMQQQIAQLSQTLRKLQHQVQVLEQRVEARPLATSPGSNPVTPNMPHAQDAKTIGIQKAQLMEKELTLQQLSSKKKAATPAEEEPMPRIPQPLEEIYLSFNDWCDQFIREGAAVEQLAADSLRVASQRPISFQQFGHRVEQQLEDPQAFRDAFEQFANQHAEGFLPVLPEIVASSDSETPALVPAKSDQGASLQKFALPPQDMYRGFNDWVEWLKQQGVDPHEFTSQDLTVPSTRQISFPQFCRRLERNLDDVESFRNAIQAEA